MNKHRFGNKKLLSKNNKLNLTALLFLLFATYFFVIKKSYAQIVDSVYYGWTVYEDKDNQNKKCYITLAPKKSDSSYTSARNPYIAITRYEVDRVEEVSIYSGYEYKISSNVSIMINGKLKQLFTNGDMAWAKHDYDDKEIIIMMLESRYLTVRSDSSVGDYAVDEYEMKGIARAYSRMKDLCNTNYNL
jgi:hypothetical protein